MCRQKPLNSAALSFRSQCGPLSRTLLWGCVLPYCTEQQTYWVDTLQVVVGGALAAGFKLTSRLLGTTPRESVDRQARAATSSSQPGTIDIEAKVQMRPKPSAFGQISGSHIKLAFTPRRHIYTSLAYIERSPSPAKVALPCQLRVPSAAPSKALKRQPWGHRSYAQTLQCCVRPCGRLLFFASLSHCSRCLCCPIDAHR